MHTYMCLYCVRICHDLLNGSMSPLIVSILKDNLRLSITCLKMDKQQTEMFALTYNK